MDKWDEMMQDFILRFPNATTKNHPHHALGFVMELARTVERIADLDIGKEMRATDDEAVFRDAFNMLCGKEIGSGSIALFSNARSVQISS